MHHDFLPSRYLSCIYVDLCLLGLHSQRPSTIPFMFIVQRIVSFLPLLFVVPNPTFSRIPFPNFRVVWW